jgi:LytS/YehU family sensor histidine kinase
MQWKLETTLYTVNIGETFLAFFIFAGFSTIITIVIDWNRQQREKTVLETKNLQTELKSLRNQINPHFLFNTLNNIYALSLKKSDRTPDMIIKLSEMMRYMLYECNERFVPLENEISYLKNYLDLEHLRQGENFSINFDIEGEILDQKIAPMLIIPFVENCFKHGVNRQLEDGYVDIQFKIETSQIRTIIKNSKPPDQPSSDHRVSGGIGLLNVKKRLDLLYKGKYTLDIKDEPESFFVDLTLKNN